VKELSESRVLVVDDSEANVDVLVEALRGEYKLSVAMDGEAALRCARRRTPTRSRKRWRATCASRARSRWASCPPT